AQLGGIYKPSSTLDNTTFYWPVRTIDSGQWVAGWSAAQTAWTNLFPPVGPTGLTVADAPSDQGTALNLSWVANTEADIKDYRLLRSTNGNVTLGSSWTVVTAVLTGTTHQDAGLTPVTTFYYRLTARDTGGNESPSSGEVNLRPVDNVAPTTPAAPTVTDAPADQGFALRINWALGADTDIREYRLYRATFVGGATGAPVLATIFSPGATHQDAGLALGATYYYAVAARDTSANQSGLSAESSSIPYDNLAPSFPTAFVVSDNPGDQGFQLQLTWANNAEPDLQDYRIFESTNAGVTVVSSHVVSAVVGTGFLRGGLANGTTYYYRLSARDVSLNESPTSSETSAYPWDIVSPSSAPTSGA
ncbi:MAG: fibronectin type III domain-containing protein, partial [bacterium]